MVPTGRIGEELATKDRCPAELDVRASALGALTEAGVPYLVAGAYAFFEYTGIFRDTKDLDVFLRERHVEDAFRALERVGFRTEITDPTWIAKGFSGEYFVDLIYSSGNGVAVVDDVWFEHARPAVVMDHPVLLAPPEEMIWSKGFVDERERYDGADVNHLIHACGDELDWERLLLRFERHWEVLFSHVALYRFAYPCDRSRVPDWVVNELCRRMLDTVSEGDWPRRVCRGNLISRVQYAHDYEQLGFEDGRRWDEQERAAHRGGARKHGAVGVDESGAEVSPGGGR
jgi:hypothetical protein